MSLGTAQEVLQKSFGSVKKIREGKIVIAETKDELWALADTDAMTRGVKFTDPTTNTQRAWKAGDAKVWSPGLQGFAPPNSDTVYVFKFSVLPTVTCHEMLHANTASGFRKTAGETVNEGTTELLAIKAMTAAGYATGQIGGGPGAYPLQRSFTSKLINLVGENTLTHAYFNDPRALVTVFEAFQGAGTWSKLRAFAEKLDETGADLLLTPPSTGQKVKLVKHLLDGWVSDDDITAIRIIYIRSNTADRSALRAVIAPQVKELWSIGQRTQLRLLLSK